MIRFVKHLLYTISIVPKKYWAFFIVDTIMFFWGVSYIKNTYPIIAKNYLLISGGVLALLVLGTYIKAKRQQKKFINGSKLI
jgi:hypothetical protein